MDLTLNIAIMKFRIFLFFAFIFCIISCKNTNEPAIKEPFDGKNVTLRIAPPSFENSTSSVAARKIWGSYSSEDSEITFSWNKNDTILISSLDDDNKIVNSTRFTVIEIDNKSGIATFEGDLPQGSTQGMYRIVSGPAVLPKNQLYEQQGISRGMMRFENEKCFIDESTELIPLFPAWSALIFNPAYTFTIEPTYDKEEKTGLNPSTVKTQIALEEFVVEIQTEDSTYTITYVNTDEDLGEVIMFTSEKGNVSTQPLILVIAPTQKCKSIIATYNHSLSTDEDYGTWGRTTSKSFKADLSHNLSQQVVKKLIFQEGNEPAFEKQVAYVLDPSTVTNITWTGTPTK